MKKIPLRPDPSQAECGEEPPRGLSSLPGFSARCARIYIHVYIYIYIYMYVYRERYMFCRGSLVCLLKGSLGFLYTNIHGVLRVVYSRLFGRFRASG